FQAEDGIRDRNVTGVQTCALPIFVHISLFIIVVFLWLIGKITCILHCIKIVEFYFVMVCCAEFIRSVYSFSSFVLKNDPVFSCISCIMSCEIDFSLFGFL